MEKDVRAAHFRKWLILSFDKTMAALMEEGRIISEDTVAARNSLILEDVKGNS